MKKTLMLVLVLAGCAAEEPASSPAAGAPPEAPADLLPIVGDYAEAGDTLSLIEEGGDLALALWRGDTRTLASAANGTFVGGAGAELSVRRGPGANVEGVSLGDRFFARLTLGAEDGGTFQITPSRPPEELRAEALAASPPLEEGDFRASDLVELTSLDSTIALDIRYATTNNFMGEVFYSQPRAFLQRPAAEALVRAQHWLKERGYGLLIHDGYRPWYVTKMFWDATPEPLRVFVADPATGSRHNRGCAVDLTLYDLATGDPITMTGGYDEMSPRSYPDYPGGTSRQRWHRELLREAMEMQGFAVYEAEWWHFDYRDWHSYRVGNERFEELGAG